MGSRIISKRNRARTEGRNQSEDTGESQEVGLGSEFESEFYPWPLGDLGKVKIHFLICSVLWRNEAWLTEFLRWAHARIGQFCATCKALHRLHCYGPLPTAGHLTLLRMGLCLASGHCTLAAVCKSRRLTQGFCSFSSMETLQRLAARPKGLTGTSKGQCR